MALWGFWVKIFGKEWLIVLGLWWVTWTFRACSLNIGYIQEYLSLHISTGWLGCLPLLFPFPINHVGLFQ